LEQGYTYSVRQVALANKFCMMVPNIRWFTVWDLFDVTSLTFRFWEIYAFLFWMNLLPPSAG
jgi:hypothetical protein